MKVFPILTAFLFLAFSYSYSQNCITGKVADKDNNEAIVGAIVKIENSPKAVFTDFDGNFIIPNVEKGSYTVTVSYVSYVTQTFTNVTVGDSSSAPTSLNVSLASESKQLTEVTVSETKITNTETAGVTEMKNSSTIVNTMSAAQIQKSQDRDASDVVKRVPGVSIVDNRFIMVRGVADRYNTVWLNDVGAPSSETDKKSFSFDVIPSGLIDRILVYKTASPELPGDFAGGMVKLYTTALPTKTGFNINYQTSYRDGTTFKPFDHTQSYSPDRFGDFNKGRALPTGTPQYIDSSDPTVDMKAVTSSFKNDWAISKKKANSDQRFNIGFNALIKKDKFKFGSVTAFNYASTYQIFKVHRQSWNDTSQVTDYTDTQSVYVSRIAAMQNFAFVLKNHKIEFRNFYNQLGQERITTRYSNFLRGPNEKSYAELYELRKTLSSQLSGNHTFFKEKTEYSWTAGYAYNTKDMPNYKRITYTKDRLAPDTAYYTSLAYKPNITNGGMFYSNLKESIKSFNHNLKQKFSLFNYNFELNAGNYIEYKQRTFIARELGYAIMPGPNASMISYYNKFTPINYIFAPENLNKPGGFQVQETTVPSDRYTAQNKQIASYIAGSFPIGRNFKLQGGVRYEKNTQLIQSKVTTDTVNFSIVTKFLLPSFNLSYSFNYKKAKDAEAPLKNIVRLAYSKTLNRPEFRELAPQVFYDFDYGRLFYGSLYPSLVNPGGGFLKVCQIENYDLRYEFYPTPGEYIQIGAFYKHFTDPIQQVIQASGGGDSPVFTFKNADNAYVQGIEVDVRKNLGFMDNWLNINFFKGLNVVGNVSIMQSQTHLSNVSFQNSTAPLQGQSPYLYNFGFYYQNDSIGTQISLLYNVFGSRLFFVGTDSDANIGEVGRKSLDLSISQRIYKKISFVFAAQNLLNTTYQLIQDTNRDGKYDLKKGDKEIANYKWGVYYSAGIKVNL